MEMRPPEFRWGVAVPVKHSDIGKSRLQEFAGPFRGELARAMAADCVAAVVSCRLVDHVLVVTDDHSAAEQFLAAGAEVVADEPGNGLNPALEFGVGVLRSGRPGLWVAALSADLPALRPTELNTALVAASSVPRAFLADAAGIGTTLLTAAPGVALKPAFGRLSRAAHRASGATEINPSGVSTLRRDVDTASDLRDAAGLGVGLRTAAVLDKIQSAL
jgi:2-phospho-L-lactate/phosphoenolpyruvate guanylyltransferase